jgi:chromosome transmission fidelity protein 1
MALARGSSGTELDFTYGQRDSPAMVSSLASWGGLYASSLAQMSELGRVLYNVCNVTPGGVVCFFPSYEMQCTIYTHWDKERFLAKIAARKKIFREPKQANQVDRVLSEYSACAKVRICGLNSLIYLF